MNAQTAAPRTVLFVALLSLAFATHGSVQEPLTNQDILDMLAAGMSDPVVLTAIETTPGSYDVDAESLIDLKNQGIPDTILMAMVNQSPNKGEATGPTEVLVSDGTEVSLRLTQTLSSKTAKVNDTVTLEAIDDLVIDGVVVVEKGSRAVGTVTEARHRKGFGRNGKVSFAIDYLATVNGQNLRLRASQTAKGNDLYGTAAVVTILTGPFGIIVKGKDVEVPAGTEYRIYVDGDRLLVL